MVATCVAVRLPSTGTLLGEALSQHEDARVTAVPTGWQDGPDGPWMDNLALVEGLPDEELARLLLAWNRRYGRPPHVIGDSFAVRLPIRVDAVGTPGMADLMRLGHEMPVMGAVAADDWAELWFSCRDAGHAKAVAARLREALKGVAGAEVRVAPPRKRDLSCWEVLQFAGGLAPELEA